MNILTLSNSPLVPTLGSGRTVLSFTKGLRDRGHNVILLGPEELTFGTGRGALVRLAYGALWGVKRSIDINTIDLVELYGGEFWPVAGWIKKKSPKPIIVSHSNGFEPFDMAQRALYSPHKGPSFLHKIRSRLIERTFKLSDRLVFLSKSDASFAKALRYKDGSEIEVVPPGLEVPFLDRPILREQSHSVGFIGSWSDRKNPECVVEVFSSLAKKDAALIFELFGTRIKAEDVIRSFPNDLHRRIKVHPELNDAELASALSTVKIIVSPSWYEGFGLGIAEAMACGAVVVSTPTGFACEVDPQYEIKIAGFGDSDGMGTLVISLLRNDPLRQQIRERAQSRVQGLKWSESCRLLADLYEGWA